MFIKNNLDWINVSIACGCLRLTRSCYYTWLNTEVQRKVRQENEDKLVQLIKTEHKQSKFRYGSPKIVHALKQQNVLCNHKKVERVMRENDIRSCAKKKFKATTNSKHTLTVFDNILNRQFIVDRPNFAWCGDITYVATDEGWLYLATVIDLYSNKVIGHATSDRINKALVISALQKALKARNYPKGVIVHSDRGSQYASNAYKDVLFANDLIGSMSRKGNCWDNAVAENLFGIIKTEYIYQTKFATRTDAKLGIFDYIEAWYNNQRIHSKLGYLCPNEFEKQNLLKNKIHLTNNMFNPNMAIKMKANILEIGAKMAEL